MKKPPDNPEEALHAYMESAKNSDHATRITAWLLRHYEYFPVPKEIYDAASSTMRQDDMPRPDKTCRACDGTGFERVWELVTYNQTGGGGMYKSVDLITDPAIAATLQSKVDGRAQRLDPCVRHCTSCGYGRSIAKPEDRELPGKADSRGPQKAGPFLIPGTDRQDAS